MTDKEEKIEAAKRRIRAPEGFTPEHMGLDDRGNVLSIAEAMPGGGLVINKTTLNEQSEGAPDEANLLAVDRDAYDIQREAAQEIAKEDQADAERRQKEADKAEAAEKKAAEASDKPAI